jgi:hypothetical protein
LPAVHVKDGWQAAPATPQTAFVSPSVTQERLAQSLVPSAQAQDRPAWHCSSSWQVVPEPPSGMQVDDVSKSQHAAPEGQKESPPVPMPQGAPKPGRAVQRLSARAQ